MTDWNKLTKHLERRGYAVRRFPSAGQAAGYLDEQINGTTVAFGGSMTLKQMGLYGLLRSHNQAVWHWEGGSLDQAAGAEVYLTSANAVAETGEIINIDGNCNRVSSSLYGHKRVYFVIGSNKVAPDFESALWRARNIAAPKNAQRLGADTPCAAKGDRCYDCDSPGRICNALAVLWRKPRPIEVMEIILVEQALGY